MQVVLTGLSNSGQDDGSLLLVLVAELLAVRLLLAPGPRPHEVSADRDEEGEGWATGDHDDPGPRDDLEHVVGTGDQAETVAAGNLPRRLARLPQGGEVVVDIGVGDLAEEVQGQTNIVKGHVLGLGSRGEGRIDFQAAQDTGKYPVEEGVAEDIGGRHRVGGELVHEDRLQHPLDEVPHDHAKGHLLGDRQLGAGVRLGQGILEELVHGWIDVVSEAQEERVEDERPKVFEHVDGSPGDLGAFIFRSAVRERATGDMRPSQTPNPKPYNPPSKKKEEKKKTGQ